MRFKFVVAAVAGAALATVLTVPLSLSDVADAAQTPNVRPGFTTAFINISGTTIVSHGNTVLWSRGSISISTTVYYTNPFTGTTQVQYERDNICYSSTSCSTPVIYDNGSLYPGTYRCYVIGGGPGGHTSDSKTVVASYYRRSGKAPTRQEMIPQ